MPVAFAAAATASMPPSKLTLRAAKAFVSSLLLRLYSADIRLLIISRQSLEQYLLPPFFVLNSFPQQPHFTVFPCDSFPLSCWYRSLLRFFSAFLLQSSEQYFFPFFDTNFFPHTGHVIFTLSCAILAFSRRFLSFILFTYLRRISAHSGLHVFLFLFISNSLSHTTHLLVITVFHRLSGTLFVKLYEILKTHRYEYVCVVFLVYDDRHVWRSF